jgi:hypothetical protein
MNTPYKRVMFTLIILVYNRLLMTPHVVQANPIRVDPFSLPTPKNVVFYATLEAAIAYVLLRKTGSLLPAVTVFSVNLFTIPVAGLIAKTIESSIPYSFPTLYFGIPEIFAFTSEFLALFLVSRFLHRRGMLGSSVSLGRAVVVSLLCNLITFPLGFILDFH